MPRPQSSGHHVANTSVYDVATANNTLNTFMGGKQKSWMTNSAPVQPSPRPPRPQQPSHQQQQQQQQLSPAVPPNLLPSPAPSDEPSPSLSNSKGSPAQCPRPLAQVQQFLLPNTNTPAAAAQQPPISPDYREVLVSSHAANIQVTAEQEIPAVQPALTIMAPPHLPDISRTEQVLPLSSVSAPVDANHVVQPPNSPAEGPPAKKRRTEPNGAPVSDVARKLATLVRLIDERTEVMGGNRNLGDIERARFRLLRDACQNMDCFYIHLHSLFCTWSIDPNNLPPMHGYDPNTIQRGFEIIESVLKQNNSFSQSNLEWCAQFPRPDFNAARPNAVLMVARFLTCLAQNWSALGDKILARGWPCLVDELLGTLHCRSKTMQVILFTACRRRLGLVDGELGIQADQYFAQDQKEHLDETGQFKSVSLPEAHTERQNSQRIILYRHLVERNEAERQEPIRQTQAQQIQQQQQQQSFARNGLANSPSNIMVASQAAYNHAQFADNQMALAVANQQRRVSLSSSSPTMQHSVQPAPWPQQMAISRPVAGSPIASSAPFPSQTQTNNRQIRAVPSDLTLQSSAAIPNSSGPGMMPVAANQQIHPQVPPSPQPYHTNLTAQGQNHHNQWAMVQLQHQQRQQQQQQQQQQMQLQLQLQYMAQSQFPLQQQLWSQFSNQPYVPNPYGPQMQFSGHPQARGYQPNYGVPQARGPMAQQQMSQQPVMVTPNNISRGASQTTLLIPRPGQIIDRSQYPHSHQERKSLLMGLHQVHARSPERTLRCGDAEERHYQSVHAFAVAPFRLGFFHGLNIDISPEQHSRLCRKKEHSFLHGNPVSTTIREYTSGSLRLRARCCRLQSSNDSVAESEWVTKESLWPEHIFIRFNNENMTIRRSTHNGKDLSVELTDFVLPGANKFEVTTSSKDPTAPDKRGNSFYLAVEIVEAVSHSDLLNRVRSNGRIDRRVTLDKIRSRVNAVPDEDGIAVIDRTGDSTQELSIDLTDPFSAKIFDVPARGVRCTHMECFDLGTWLSTRPVKQQIKCGHQDICTCPKRKEPSEPDKWKCPICFGDARPGSLRIDSFLEDVRKQLQSENKLDTKSILVTADGSWRPVIEPADDDDDSNVDASVSRKTGAPLRTGLSKSVSIERAPVEIIELD